MTRMCFRCSVFLALIVLITPMTAPARTQVQKDPSGVAIGKVSLPAQLPTGQAQTGTVELTQNAGPNGQLTYLSATPSPSVNIPTYVTVPAGRKTVDFDITAVFGASGSVTVRASEAADPLNFKEATAEITNPVWD